MTGIEDALNAIVAGGFTMRWPAGQHERFAQSAAESLIGTHTTVNARDFGSDETWRVEIVAARVVEDGRAVELTMRPVGDPVQPSSLPAGGVGRLEAVSLGVDSPGPPPALELRLIEASER